MTDLVKLPPPPGMCQRKNCVTRTEGKPFKPIYDGDSFWCNTCGLRMKTIVYFIAFREDDRDMIPVSNDGVISLFHTLSEAKSAGGQLGGGIATEFDGLKAICERFGLTF